MRKYQRAPTERSLTTLSSSSSRLSRSFSSFLNNRVSNTNSLPAETLIGVVTRIQVIKAAPSALGSKAPQSQQQGGVRVTVQPDGALDERGVPQLPPELVVTNMGLLTPLPDVPIALQVHYNPSSTDRCFLLFPFSFSSLNTLSLSLSPPLLPIHPAPRQPAGSRQSAGRLSFRARARRA